MSAQQKMAAAFRAVFGYEGVTHAGVALVALDTGRFLLTQRALDETDAPDVRETWEFPGGGLDEGEDAQAGAFREFDEETGMPLADSPVVNGWRAGHYQGFVVTVKMEFPVDGDDTPEIDPREVKALRWTGVNEAQDMIEQGMLRPELHDFDWTLVDVSGNEENPMDDEPEIDAELEEPDLTLADVFDAAIPVHGVLAPEGAESGDSRAFNEGSVTARPYRLPFMWQKAQTSGHDNAVVVGSVDRLMRKNGMIHWEGRLMPGEDGGEFANLLAFFGRFGVSVDGDRGKMDAAKTEATGVLWFEAVRAAGLTAVSIPAYAEAYVAFGPHPEMPQDDDSQFALVASGEMVSFDRGPGWGTHPKETNRLHSYWTKKGQPGYAKIGWGTPGDFTRAKKLIGAKIGANSPEDMKYLNQIIAQWHHDALGYWPGELDKPGNKTSAQAKAERAAKASLEDETPSLAAMHESSAAVNAKAAEDGWEAVLTSSAGARVLPPAHYFDRHEDTGALVVEEPDENGIRRTYGYAGEWGVCHIGFDGQCVNVPFDAEGGEYAEFHLGRTRVADGEPINTGLITYAVDHRGKQQILSESAQQQHFDNVAHAWAAVRLGEDERGVWFSGVVLPHVPEDDLVLIEAAGQVSGEWKYGALRSLLAVNVPGFPVLRSSATIDDEGQVETLVASIGANIADAPCPAEAPPTPGEIMAAMAAVDAEVRFQKLREEWEG